jgi:hypothetical protein
MLSCVGLSRGTGGEGARMTARMFFGGWLYPDVPWIGAVDFAAAFGKDEVDCAAMGTDAAQASSAQAKRQFKAFWIGINCLRFISPGKP